MKEFSFPKGTVPILYGLKLDAIDSHILREKNSVEGGMSSLTVKACFISRIIKEAT